MSTERMSLAKLAYVTGAQHPTASQGQLLADQKGYFRRKHEYHAAKAKEGRTSWGNALSTGGIVGASAGALHGLTGGKNIGKKTLLGGVIGAGIGGLAKVVDDQNIDHSKHLMRLSDRKRSASYRSSTASALDAQHRRERQQDALRHMEMMNAVSATAARRTR